MNNRQIPFWLITATAFVALTVPVLLQDGMFMDGLQYACVSKNLAHGLGTFWFPYLSPTWSKAGSTFFMEHPPLVYGIQSVFFKLLGDSMYVERFYSLTTFIITAYLIILIWKQVCDEDSELKKLSWLPVLLWIIIPVCFWSYQNNMMENTMGIFTASSVYFTLRGLRQKQLKWFLLSGCAIFLATLSKGLPGAFPIVAVMLFWLSNKSISFKRAISYTLIICIIPILLYSILLINNEARNSLLFYVNERLFDRINHEQSSGSRFFILYKLLSELLLPVLLCFILIIAFRLKAIIVNNNYKNSIIFFLLIGAAGSLPLLFTPVQKGFYFVPSLPFYALGLALLVGPGLKEIINRIKVEGAAFKYFKIFSAMLLSAVIVFCGFCFGKFGRDKEMLQDVYLIGNTINKGQILKVDEPLYEQWNLQFYFIRYFDIYMDHSGKNHDYYLTEKTIDNSKLIQCEKVKMNTSKYDLYSYKN